MTLGEVFVPEAEFVCMADTALMSSGRVARQHPSRQTAGVGGICAPVAARWTVCLACSRGCEQQQGGPDLHCAFQLHTVNLWTSAAQRMQFWHKIWAPS